MTGQPPQNLTNDPSEAFQEATQTLHELFLSFYAILPKLFIAIALFIFAAFVTRLARYLLRRFLHQWEKSEAIGALLKITIYLFTLAAALSIVVGDAKALVGSIGLIGLALSWALQTPIESFTGWFLNSFRSYYRIGDRIEVGGVFGDVYKIDILTTTVWEAGGQGKPVTGAQPTGALITFPNWEVLRSNIVNYSKDFPYVWDEISLSVTNESDLSYAMAVIRKRAEAIMGEIMQKPAQQYQELLQQAKLAFDIAQEPQIYLSQDDAWTNIVVRYLVPVRERRRWATELLLALSKEISAKDHAGRIRAAYPRTEIALATIPDSDFNQSFQQKKGDI
jgi:small-conductance mechanosensitive channel